MDSRHPSMDLSARSREILVKPIPGKLDKGIERAVRTFQANGIETFESCEGGEGHAYPEPTIRCHGGPETGWRALSICLAYGLPVAELRRVWDVLESNEPTGPHWEVVFKQKMPPRDL